MSVSALCPSCSARFYVKDELAGKRIKCPKCGEPMAISMVAVKEPRVVEDAEDERPNSKRPRNDDDEDDRPRSKKRRRDDDYEEEWPRKKGKKATKKGSPLPLILGIGGGMIVLGGVITAVVLLSNNAPDQAKVQNPNQPNPNQVQVPSGPAPGVSAEGFARLKQGMALAEVEGVLGKGRAPSRLDISGLTALTSLPEDLKREVEDRWESQQHAGHVHQWRKGTDLVIAVAFDKDPASGGAVCGLASRTGRDYSEPLKVAAAPYPPNTPLTVVQLTEFYDKYRGKEVTLVGKIGQISEPSDQSPREVQFQKPDRTLVRVRILYPKEKWTSKFYQPGDTIEVKGISSDIVRYAGDLFVELQNPLVLKRTDVNGEMVPPVPGG